MHPAGINTVVRLRLIHPLDVSSRGCRAEDGGPACYNLGCDGEPVHLSTGSWSSLRYRRVDETNEMVLLFFDVGSFVPCSSPHSLS